MRLLLFLVLGACGRPGADSSPPADEQNVCGGGEQITIESGYDPKGNSFDWTVEDAFGKAGGTLDVGNAAQASVTCPPCTESGTTEYAIAVAVTDAGGTKVWVYGHIELRCD